MSLNLLLVTMKKRLFLLTTVATYLFSFLLLLLSLSSLLHTSSSSYSSDSSFKLILGVEAAGGVPKIIRLTCDFDPLGDYDLTFVNGSQAAAGCDEDTTLEVYGVGVNDCNDIRIGAPASSSNSNEFLNVANILFYGNSGGEITQNNPPSPILAGSLVNQGTIAGSKVKIVIDGVKCSLKNSYTASDIDSLILGVGNNSCVDFLSPVQGVESVSVTRVEATVPPNASRGMQSFFWRFQEAMKPPEQIVTKVPVSQTNNKPLQYHLVRHNYSSSVARIKDGYFVENNVFDWSATTTSTSGGGGGGGDDSKILTWALTNPNASGILAESGASLDGLLFTVEGSTNEVSFFVRNNKLALIPDFEHNAKVPDNIYVLLAVRSVLFRCKDVALQVSLDLRSNNVTVIFNPTPGRRYLQSNPDLGLGGNRSMFSEAAVIMFQADKQWTSVGSFNMTSNFVHFSSRNGHLQRFLGYFAVFLDTLQGVYSSSSSSPSDLSSEFNLSDNAVFISITNASRLDSLILNVRKTFSNWKLASLDVNNVHIEGRALNPGLSYISAATRMLLLSTGFANVKDFSLCRNAFRILTVATCSRHEFISFAASTTSSKRLSLVGVLLVEGNTVVYDGYKAVELFPPAPAEEASAAMHLQQTSHCSVSTFLRLGGTQPADKFTFVLVRNNTATNRAPQIILTFSSVFVSCFSKMEKFDKIHLLDNNFTSQSFRTDITFDTELRGGTSGRKAFSCYLLYFLGGISQLQENVLVQNNILYSNYYSMNFPNLRSFSVPRQELECFLFYLYGPLENSEAGSILLLNNSFTFLSRRERDDGQKGNFKTSMECIYYVTPAVFRWIPLVAHQRFKQLNNFNASGNSMEVRDIFLPTFAVSKSMMFAAVVFFLYPVLDIGSSIVISANKFTISNGVAFESMSLYICVLNNALTTVPFFTMHRNILNVSDVHVISRNGTASTNSYMPLAVFFSSTFFGGSQASTASPRPSATDGPGINTLFDSNQLHVSRASALTFRFYLAGFNGQIYNLSKLVVTNNVMNLHSVVTRFCTQDSESDGAGGPSQTTCANQGIYGSTLFVTAKVTHVPQIRSEGNTFVAVNVSSETPFPFPIRTSFPVPKTTRIVPDNNFLLPKVGLSAGAYLTQPVVGHKSYLLGQSGIFSLSHNKMHAEKFRNLELNSISMLHAFGTIMVYTDLLFVNNSMNVTDIAMNETSSSSVPRSCESFLIFFSSCPTVLGVFSILMQNNSFSVSNLTNVTVRSGGGTYLIRQFMLSNVNQIFARPSTLSSPLPDGVTITQNTFRVSGIRNFAALDGKNLEIYFATTTLCYKFFYTAGFWVENNAMTVSDLYDCHYMSKGSGCSSGDPPGNELDTATYSRLTTNFFTVFAWFGQMKSASVSFNNLTLEGEIFIVEHYPATLFLMILKEYTDLDNSNVTFPQVNSNIIHVAGNFRSTGGGSLGGFVIWNLISNFVLGDVVPSERSRVSFQFHRNKILFSGCYFAYGTLLLAIFSGESAKGLKNVLLIQGSYNYIDTSFSLPSSSSSSSSSSVVGGRVEIVSSDYSPLSGLSPACIARVPGDLSGVYQIVIEKNIANLTNVALSRLPFYLNRTSHVVPRLVTAEIHFEVLGSQLEHLWGDETFSNVGRLSINANKIIFSPAEFLETEIDLVHLSFPSSSPLNDNNDIRAGRMVAKDKAPTWLLLPENENALRTLVVGNYSQITLQVFRLRDKIQAKNLKNLFWFADNSIEIPSSSSSSSSGSGGSLSSHDRLVDSIKVTKTYLCIIAYHPTLELLNENLLVSIMGNSIYLRHHTLMTLRPLASLSRWNCAGTFALYAFIVEAMYVTSVSCKVQVSHSNILLQSSIVNTFCPLLAITFYVPSLNGMFLKAIKLDRNSISLLGNVSTAISSYSSSCSSSSSSSFADNSELFLTDQGDGWDYIYVVHLQVDSAYQYVEVAVFGGGFSLENNEIFLAASLCGLAPTVRIASLASAVQFPIAASAPKSFYLAWGSIQVEGNSIKFLQDVLEIPLDAYVSIIHLPSCRGLRLGITIQNNLITSSHQKPSTLLVFSGSKSKMQKFYSKYNREEQNRTSTLLTPGNVSELVPSLPQIMISILSFGGKVTHIEQNVRISNSSILLDNSHHLPPSTSTAVLFHSFSHFSAHIVLALGESHIECDVNVYISNSNVSIGKIENIFGWYLSVSIFSPFQVKMQMVIIDKCHLQVAHIGKNCSTAIFDSKEDLSFVVFSVVQSNLSASAMVTDCSVRILSTAAERVVFGIAKIRDYSENPSFFISRVSRSVDVRYYDTIITGSSVFVNYSIPPSSSSSSSSSSLWKPGGNQVFILSDDFSTAQSYIIVEDNSISIDAFSGEDKKKEENIFFFNDLSSSSWKSSSVFIVAALQFMLKSEKDDISTAVPLFLIQRNRLIFVSSSSSSGRVFCDRNSCGVLSLRGIDNEFAAENPFLLKNSLLSTDVKLADNLLFPTTPNATTSTTTTLPPAEEGVTAESLQQKALIVIEPSISHLGRNTSFYIKSGNHIGLPEHNLDDDSNAFILLLGGPPPPPVFERRNGGADEKYLYNLGNSTWELCFSKKRDLFFSESVSQQNSSSSSVKLMCLSLTPTRSETEPTLSTSLSPPPSLSHSSVLSRDSVSPSLSPSQQTQTISEELTRTANITHTKIPTPSRSRSNSLTENETLTDPATHTATVPTQSATLSEDVPRERLSQFLPAGTTVAATAISLAAAAPSAAGFMQKMRALQGLSQCGAQSDFLDDDGPPSLSFDTNPTYLKIGTQPSMLLAEYYGSVVGNSILILALLFLQNVAALIYVHRQNANRVPMSLQLARSTFHMPGLIAIPLLVFVTPSVFSVATVAASLFLGEDVIKKERLISNVASYAIILLGAVVYFFAPLYLFGWVASECNQHEALIDAKKTTPSSSNSRRRRRRRRRGGRNDNNNSNSNNDNNDSSSSEDDDDESGEEDEQEEGMFDFVKQSLESFFSYILAAWKEWKSTQFTDAFGDIFESFSAPWFAVFDYFVAAAIGLATGSMLLSKDRAHCFIAAVVCVFVTSFRLLTIFVVRPFITRIDLVFGTVASVFEVIGSTLALLEISDVNVDFTNINFITAIIAFAAAGAALLPKLSRAYRALSKGIRKIVKEQKRRRRRRRNANASREGGGGGEENEGTSNDNNNNQSSSSSSSFLRRRGATGGRRRRRALGASEQMESNLREVIEKEGEQNQQRRSRTTTTSGGSGNQFNDPSSAEGNNNNTGEDDDMSLLSPPNSTSPQSSRRTSGSSSSSPSSSNSPRGKRATTNNNNNNNSNASGATTTSRRTATNATPSATAASQPEQQQQQEEETAANTVVSPPRRRSARRNPNFSDI